MKEKLRKFGAYLSGSKKKTSDGGQKAEKIIPTITTKRQVEEHGFTTLEIEGVVYKTKLTKKFEKRKIWTGKKPEEIRAVISGTILGIGKEGQLVKEGGTLLVIEYMKMRNRIMCPGDAIIKKVLVAKDQHAEKDDLLILIEFVKK